MLKLEIKICYNRVAYFELLTTDSVFLLLLFGRKELDVSSELISNVEMEFSNLCKSDS